MVSFQECCHQDDGGDMLEPGKTIHDFVLLTPGGKYVPLVRTRSDSPEKVVFTECCVDAGRLQQQRVPEVCENGMSLFHRIFIYLTTNIDCCV